MKEAWEQIDKETSRLKCAGGWIVRNIAMVTIQKMAMPAGMVIKPGQPPVGRTVNEHLACAALCFVPDEEHEWTLTEEEVPNA